MLSSSFSSSSLAPPSFWSWASVVYVVCSCCWWSGRVKCWLLEPAACKIAFHGVPFRSVVSQVVSFARSLLSLLVLVGCRCALMSSSHLLACLPCFRYPFCLVDIAEFHLEISLVQPSWCLAIFLARLQYILLFLRIHDVIQFAANRSSAW